VSDFLPSTGDELSSFIAAPLVAGGAKLILPPKQGKEHLIVTKTPTKVEEATLLLPTANDLITPALWNLQIPQQPNETSGDFGKHRAAVDHLMSDPMMAALLSTMAKTPDIYIEANRFASNHKTPELGPTREMDQNSHRALDPQLPVVKPIRPSRQVQLHTSWDDRVNFQHVHNSQISDYGQSTIDDQGIWFDG
jgi:hypothetical protein